MLEVGQRRPQAPAQEVGEDVGFWAQVPAVFRPQPAWPKNRGICVTGSGKRRRG